MARRRPRVDDRDDARDDDARRKMTVMVYLTDHDSRCPGDSRAGLTGRMD